MAEPVTISEQAIAGQNEASGTSSKRQGQQRQEVSANTHENILKVQKLKHFLIQKVLFGSV